MLIPSSSDAARFHLRHAVPELPAPALVRLDRGASIGPGLEESEPTFDELALGYLATPQRRRAEVPA